MPGPPRCRILVVEDHVEVRAYIRELVSREFEVVGETGDGVEAAAMVRDLKPDVVLLDISMRRLSGFGVLRQLVREKLGVKILFVSQHLERRYLMEARNSGAQGYVLKSRMRKDLLPAIRQVTRGGPYVAPAA
jgi:DNA-binding NarL/FixJ family response regulator